MNHLASNMVCRRRCIGGNRIVSYFIKKGTRVTVRRPNAKPTEWFSYQTQKDLRLGEPLSIERGSYLFEYQNWRIRVRKNQVELAANRKSA